MTCLNLLGIGMTFDDGDACAGGKDAAYDGLSPTCSGQTRSFHASGTTFSRLTVRLVALWLLSLH